MKENRKHKWKKRYYRIVNGFLFRYKNDKSTTPNIMFNLKECQDISNADVKSNRKLSFELIFNKKRIILSAATEKNYNKWFDQLQLCFQSRKYNELIDINLCEEKKKKLKKLLNHIEIKKKDSLVSLENSNINNEKKLLKNLTKTTKFKIKIAHKNKNNIKNIIFNFDSDLIVSNKSFLSCKQINYFNHYQTIFLGIIARLTFPQLEAKEVGYSIDDHQSILFDYELSFKRHQWFILNHEHDELFIQVETGDEIGIVLREKIQIIDIATRERVFKIYNNSDNNTQVVNNKGKPNSSSITNLITTTNNMGNNNIIKNKKETINKKINPIIELYQFVKFEQKSGQSFPIIKQDFLEIEMKRKFQKKHLRLISWFLGVYDNERSIQPIEAIDLRNLKDYYFINSKNKANNQLKFRIKGKLTQILKYKDQDKLLQWFEIFNIVKLFIKLSQPIKENENLIKRYEQYLILFNWIETEIIRYDETKKNLLKKSQKQKENLNIFKSNKPESSDIKFTNNTLELLRQFNKQLALLNSWKKILLSKAARLKITDKQDNRVRVFCLQDYSGMGSNGIKNNANNINTNTGGSENLLNNINKENRKEESNDNELKELSFNKYEWLILIRKQMGGMLHAEKNGIIGKIHSKYIYLVKPYTTQRKIKPVRNVNKNILNLKELFLKRLYLLIQFNLNSCINTRKYYQNLIIKSNKQKSNTTNIKNDRDSNDDHTIDESKNVNGNEERDYDFPFFLDCNCLVEFKNGSNKFLKRICVIYDWTLFIFKKHCIEIFYNLNTMVSVELSDDYNRKHQNCFIIYFEDKELRIVIENHNSFLIWFNILKNH
ncbi:dual adapter for phosphotyrosine and 3-phosphotyrosine and 3-phosphoinositide [Anaeramoeba flamelloides]|uniref:Dual adapter for phosphotyrosine and 3-phosphotyrosine and 3-phosphoinositide n=1 Tax=Anaeramoeba flamelloides TaxID=1746091 RepID=A0AAV8AGT9_9EUKA|nr:dual adapter for phosphotyrosine and 3-phosphotyrosine and 3-phosphoinositide [Anaeramoeba flamelloides]